MSSGVLQASILGPLLFVLTVNTLFQIQISNSAFLKVYADDIVLYNPVRCEDNLGEMQSDVTMIAGLGGHV